MHKSTYEKMNWFKDNYLHIETQLNILDIGSLDNSGNNFNYRSIFENNNWKYTGLDYEDGDNVDILVNDIYNIVEIKDNSYDIIISGQLFEHLGFFWLTMGEIERILKPGGLCCIIAPSGGPKHGSRDSDCYRFHEASMKFLAKYAEFEILHVSTNNSEESKPWFDTCLVAKKPGTLNSNSEELEEKINDLEHKLEVILNNVDK